MRHFIAVLILGLAAPVSAQLAVAEWAAEFGPQGLSEELQVMVRLDDGSGLTLFAVTGGRQVFKLVNDQWTAYGPPVELSGLASQGIRALSVFDDGNGRALWIAGRFQIASSTASHVNVARLGASGWVAMASFPDPAFPPIPTVTHQMITLPQPTGDRLIVAQEFGLSLNASTLHELSGGIFSPIATTGFSAIFVRALLAVDDGTTTSLVVSGQFLPPGGLVPTNGVAQLVGSALVLVGAPFSGPPNALIVHDDGQGPRLFAGGGFSAVGATLINSFAAFDGVAWSAVDIGISGGDILSLENFNDGNGWRLFLGGTFNAAGGVAAQAVAVWDGQTLGPTGPGGGFVAFSGARRVNALARSGVGTAVRLFAGGRFDQADGHEARNVAEFVSGTWQVTRPLQGANEGIFGTVERFTIDPDTDRLLVLGDYLTPNGARAFTRWEEPGWVDPYAANLTANDRVNCASIFNPGSGGEYFVGGSFTLLGGVFVNHIARFDGMTWRSLGSGFSVGVGSLGSVKTVMPFDDGSGLKLFVGGDFFNAGPLPSQRGVARWDGTTWSSASAGLTMGDFEDFQVADLGNGPRLFAGGQFNLTGGTTAEVVTWTPTGWLAVGMANAAGTTPGRVKRLFVHDDGSGLALFAGGSFSALGGVPAANIARWNGTAWSPLTGGLTVPAGMTQSPVAALTSHDFGQGPRLVAGGAFTVADGQAADHLATWDGTNWQALNGLNGPVTALTSFDDGTAPALFVSGTFSEAGTKASVGLARYGFPAPRIRLQQPLGPGTSIFIELSNLRPNHQLVNLFSLEPCPGPVGSGPYVGLCTADPMALLVQSQLPIGAIPFRMITTESTLSIGPYPSVSGVVIETRSIDVFPAGNVFSASSVHRFTIP